ncbi:MAG: hypothetical protein A2176_03285 [Spirochaetes bacterium RBG_13_51_14]|nr:MAG: hypothetical protein A2176_03285 [Spirochaetes bacterium RBG_13_51_14]
MKYTKPPLSFETQADQLIKRGLETNRELLISRLKAVSYYRLSGYWHPFRIPTDDNFKENTTFEQIWHRYVFDRQLRLCFMDAIERIEIALRTDCIYYFSHEYGPFSYLKSENFPNISVAQHNRLLTTIYSETLKSNEIFVKHFNVKYGDEHTMLPLWMIAEIIPFGSLLTFYKGIDKTIKRIISQKYDLSFKIMESWLMTLNTIRNICAHHGRLWNRELGIKPIIPDTKSPEWHTPVKIDNHRMFCILTILRYLLKYIAPQSEWHNRLEKLLNKYPDVPFKSMGFPDGWEESEIWN